MTNYQIATTLDQASEILVVGLLDQSQIAAPELLNAALAAELTACISRQALRFR